MLTFQDALNQIGPNEGRYNQFLKALELMFGQVGITDIGWQEMGSTQHNHLSMLIDEIDLKRVAEGYAGMVSMLARHAPNDPDSDWRLSREASINFSLQGSSIWFKAYLKELKVRRGTKKYEALLIEKRPAAQASIRAIAEETREKAEKNLIRLIEENKSKLARYEEGAVYARRCAYIIRALAKIAGIEPDEATITLLENRAELIEKAAANRRAYLATVKVTSTEDMIEAALRPYPELKELWGGT